MTDEKLEQILQQALTPSVNEEDILTYKRVRKQKMNNGFLKIGIAVAACVAVVFTGLKLDLIKTKQPTKGEGEIVQSTEETVQKSSNPFVLTCYAAEMEQGVRIPVLLEGGACNNYGIGEGDTLGTIYFSIGTNFTCQGENIESIKYQINKGAFSIVESKETPSIVDYKQYDGEEVCSMFGFVDGELQPGQDESESKYNSYMATEYTVSYDNQSSDSTLIGVCGFTDDKNVFDKVFGSDTSVDNKIEGFSEMTKEIEITCTVQYKDQTTETKVVTITGCEYMDGENEDVRMADFAYVLQ